MKNEEIIDKLGGKKVIAERLGLSIGAVYLWFYPKPKGCGGSIPPRQAIKIQELAEKKGIDCTLKEIMGE